MENNLKMENENGSGTKENNIILLTIKNAVYPITTDVIQRVANRSGQIDRIVIFKKKFVQVRILCQIKNHSQIIFISNL